MPENLEHQQRGVQQAKLPIGSQPQIGDGMGRTVLRKRQGKKGRSKNLSLPLALVSLSCVGRPFLVSDCSTASSIF